MASPVKWSELEEGDRLFVRDWAEGARHRPGKLPNIGARITVKDLERLAGEAGLSIRDDAIRS